MDSPHKGTITQKMFLFDYVIMYVTFLVNGTVMIKCCFELYQRKTFIKHYPDSKVHGAHLGPAGPHVGHMNSAIWVFRLISCSAVMASIYLRCIVSVYIAIVV